MSQFFEKSFYPISFYYLGMFTKQDEQYMCLPNLNMKSIFVDYFNDINKIDVSSKYAEMMSGFVDNPDIPALFAGHVVDLLSILFFYSCLTPFLVTFSSNEINVEKFTKIVYNTHMPTVFKVKGFRFFFFTREGNEPVHIHIAKDKKYAKFWLEPITLSKNYGFISKELKLIKNLIIENQDIIKEKWNECFSK